MCEEDERDERVQDKRRRSHPDGCSRRVHEHSAAGKADEHASGDVAILLVGKRGTRLPGHAGMYRC